MSSELNVDPQEIDKFNELASRWWDPNGEFKPLHRMNPLRIDYIDRRVKRARESIRIRTMRSALSFLKSSGTASQLGAKRRSLKTRFSLRLRKISLSIWSQGTASFIGP